MRRGWRAVCGGRGGIWRTSFSSFSLALIPGWAGWGFILGLAGWPRAGEEIY